MRNWQYQIRNWQKGHKKVRKTVLSLLQFFMRQTLLIVFLHFSLESKASQNCPCTSLQECEWANNLLSLLKDLTSTNPNRVKAITFIRRQVMIKGKQSITVYGTWYIITA